MRRLLLPLCVAVTLAPAAAAPRNSHAAHAVSYAARPEVQRFVAEMSERRALPPRWVAAQIAYARRVPAVQRLIMPAPAGKPKDWAVYRARFVEPQRIAAGLSFWHDNAAALAAAEARFGVPPEIVVGLIGVETYYGRIVGSFRVLDALSTLAFDFPRGRSDRSDFFRKELEEFLVWCAREGLDARTPRGSYAGAMGLPQFMPSSLNRYGVDFGGDGRIDLRSDAADAIGSVAHYLAEAGWQRDLPTHYAVEAPAALEDRAALLAPDIVPTFSAAQFAAHGAALDAAARAYPGLLALVALENGGRDPSYVAATTNFYALTRYNASSYYAMAVIELAAALRAMR